MFVWCSAVHVYTLGSPTPRLLPEAPFVRTDETGWRVDGGWISCTTCQSRDGLDEPILLISGHGRLFSLHSAGYNFWNPRQLFAILRLSRRISYDYKVCLLVVRFLSSLLIDLSKIFEAPALVIVPRTKSVPTTRTMLQLNDPPS